MLENLNFSLIGGAVLFIGVIGIIASGYVKAPPDRAYIISGFRKNPKVLVGRAGIKIPFLERLDKLYLGQFSVDIKTNQTVPTSDFIDINVDAVAKIRVNPTPEGIELASRNFLNKQPDEIAADLQDSLEGNMREIIGTLDFRALNNDRDSFSDEVMLKAGKDMEKLGIEIVSCNIQNVSDESGLIKDLGAENTAKIRKDAKIAAAQANKEVAIAEAKANQEANAEMVQSEALIAERENTLAIKKAELKKQSDIKKAESDAAYSIQSQEQNKQIAVAKANAMIAQQEREVELNARMAEVAEKKLDADIRKKADAEKYEMQMQADARLYERQKEAEAKKYEKIQEAEGIMELAKAEAESIRIKGEAQAEALSLEADAKAKLGQAQYIQWIIEKLPDIAREVSAPLANIDKITVIEGGAGESGVDRIGNYVPQVMARTFESVKEATGVDIKEIIRKDTYDAAVNRQVALKTAISKEQVPIESVSKIEEE